MNTELAAYISKFLSPTAQKAHAASKVQTPPDKDAKPSLLESVLAAAKANRELGATGAIAERVTGGLIFTPLPSSINQPLPTPEEQARFLRLLQRSDNLIGPCA